MVTGGRPFCCWWGLLLEPLPSGYTGAATQEDLAILPRQARRARAEAVLARGGFRHATGAGRAVLWDYLVCSCRHKSSSSHCVKSDCG